MPVEPDMDPVCGLLIIVIWVTPLVPVVCGVCMFIAAVLGV